MQHPLANTFVRGITLKKKNKGCILVAGGRDPFGQHPESQPLAEFDFLSMRRVFASYSQSDLTGRLRTKDS